MPVRLTAREVTAVLSKHGFVCVSQSGSHQKWRNAKTLSVAIVPFHKGKQLSQGTLYSIIRSSKIDKSEFGLV